MRISDWSSDVCSSDLLPEEGKSSLAGALAVCAAQATGKRVVLVDFDLWRPTLERAFDLPPSSGVSDFLIDGDWTTLELYPDLQFQRRAKLDVFPAGRRPNERPAERGVG